MFSILGRWVGRWPFVIVLSWFVVLAVAVIWSLYAEHPPAGDMGSFLPEDAPHNQAVNLFRSAFPDIASRSQIVVVGYRAGGLTPGDISWLSQLGVATGKMTNGKVLSPAMPFFNRRLVSPDNQVAMIVANLSSNFVSPASVLCVNEVETLTQNSRPEGLVVEITGIAGIGRDYARATEAAIHHTTWVTVIAVLVILMVVYRSVVGAMVPLVSIGASVYLAFVLLAVLMCWGWQISGVERLFAVVLLFGAGVDYALFWIAKYRELLGEKLDFEWAAFHASRATSPAIVASAATTICGLTMMLAADLVPSRNAGKVLAPILFVSLLASLSLSPAMARLLKGGLFWPMGLKANASLGQRFLWPKVSGMVVRRPGAVWLIGTLLLAIPAVASVRLQPRFDSLSELPPGSSSERGYKILEQHFSPGQLFSTQVVVEFKQRPATEDEQRRLCRELSRRIMALDGVEDIYSVDAPLGMRQAGMMDSLIRPVAGRFYVSDISPVLRLEILLRYPPFSREAMRIYEKMQAVAAEQAASWAGVGLETRIMMSGLTPYIIDVREYSRNDQIRVMSLVTLVIAFIVLVMVKDLLLTIFMVLSTWLTYGATLVLAHGCFVYLLGETGIDWKVRLIVFVIVVAVGQDYNIFLVSRLLQEMRHTGPSEATRRAIIMTGSVISSCGIIMAATLGSLWVGGLSLLRQVGLALSLGILIDTFFVRPVLIPSFFLLIKGRNRQPPIQGTPANPVSDTGT